MGSSLIPRGRLLALQGVKGGVGTSTLACLLGRSLARSRPESRILLVDFTPPGLSLLPLWTRLDGAVRRLSDLPEGTDARSRTLLEGFFPRSPEGLIHLAADPEPAGDASRRLAQMAAWADWILLDLSSLGPREQAYWRDRSHGLLLLIDDDPASMAALPFWERRLLSEHYDLSACLVWLNDLRGSRMPLGGSRRDLLPTWTVPHLGQGLSLRLSEETTIPAGILNLLKPGLEALQDPSFRRRPDPDEAAVPSSEKSPDSTESLETVRVLHQRLLEHLRSEGVLRQDRGFAENERAALEPRAREALERFVQELGPADRDHRKTLVAEALRLAFGLGPLEPLLADETVTEIMVNGPRNVFVEREGRLVRTEARFLDEQQLRTVIERILAPLGRRIDEAQPTVDARLPDGSRVNAVIPPLSLEGPVLTIRKFSRKALTAEDLVASGSLSREAAEFLGACVRARKNLVVSGGTGSGKTTLLNVLSGFIPPTERIVTIEDSAELRLSQDHVVRLEARPANLEGKGRVTIRDLVVNALRMRPDRIVVGEVRSGEALDMLQAMNTGHDGSLTTAHANSPRDVLSRLETMCLMSGVDLPLRAVREQVARAVHLVVQQSRLPGGRRAVTHISEVQGMDGEVILLQDLFTWEKGQGLVRRPFSPSFLKDLENHGYRAPRPDPSVA